MLWQNVGFYKQIWSYLLLDWNPEMLILPGWRQQSSRSPQGYAGHGSPEAPTSRPEAPHFLEGASSVPPWAFANAMCPSAPNAHLSPSLLPYSQVLLILMSPPECHLPREAFQESQTEICYIPHVLVSLPSLTCSLVLPKICLNNLSNDLFATSLPGSIEGDMKARDQVRLIRRWVSSSLPGA